MSEGEWDAVLAAIHEGWDREIAAGARAVSEIYYDNGSTVLRVTVPPSGTLAALVVDALRASGNGVLAAMVEDTWVEKE